MDISSTAIEKAKKSYPDLDFFVGNIAEYREGFKQFDACLFAEIMWYILDDLDTIIQNMQKYFQGRIVIVNQAFYKPGVQQYGKEYFTNLDEMCEYLPWSCIEKIVEQDLETGSIETHSVFRLD